MMKRSSSLHGLLYITSSLAENLTNELLMKKALLGASTLAVLGAVALPAVTLAATYAYVNTSGEVMTTEATTWQSAIQTAPMIAPTSGVMLIETTADEGVLDQDVSGV